MENREADGSAPDKRGSRSPNGAGGCAIRVAIRGFSHEEVGAGYPGGCGPKAAAGMQCIAPARELRMQTAESQDHHGVLEFSEAHDGLRGQTRMAPGEAINQSFFACPNWDAGAIWRWMLNSREDQLSRSYAAPAPTDAGAGVAPVMLHSQVRRISRLLRIMVARAEGYTPGR